MKELLDRMQEEVTVPLRIVGLKGKKEVQLIDDACLKSLMEIVRDDEREKQIEISDAMETAAYYKGRADERERCVQIAKDEMVGANDDDHPTDISYDLAITHVINAIKAEDTDDHDQDVSGYEEIIEIYAGMEGFIPETAPEAYQKRIIEQMYEAAINAIKAGGG